MTERKTAPPRTGLPALARLRDELARRRLRDAPADLDFVFDVLDQIVEGKTLEEALGLASNWRKVEETRGRDEALRRLVDGLGLTGKPVAEASKVLGHELGRFRDGPWKRARAAGEFLTLDPSDRTTEPAILALGADGRVLKKRRLQMILSSPEQPAERVQSRPLPIARASAQAAPVTSDRPSNTTPPAPVDDDGEAA